MPEEERDKERNAEKARDQIKTIALVAIVILLAVGIFGVKAKLGEITSSLYRIEDRMSRNMMDIKDIHRELESINSKMSFNAISLRKP